MLATSLAVLGMLGNVLGMLVTFLAVLGMLCNVLGMLGNVLGQLRHALQRPRCPTWATSKRNPPTFYLINFTHTHTHTHTYIYIYNYEFPASCINVTRFLASLYIYI